MNVPAKVAAPVIAIALAAESLVGCSRAQLSRVGEWGNPSLVEKYSGGKLVYAGIANGKVENESGSDGYYFSDALNGGRVTHVSGDVVITRPEPMPSREEVLKLVDGPKLGYGSN